MIDSKVRNFKRILIFYWINWHLVGDVVSIIPVAFTFRDPFNWYPIGTVSIWKLISILFSHCADWKFETTNTWSAGERTNQKATMTHNTDRNEKNLQGHPVKKFLSYQHSQLKGHLVKHETFLNQQHYLDHPTKHSQVCNIQRPITRNTLNYATFRRSTCETFLNKQHS